MHTNIRPATTRWTLRKLDRRFELWQVEGWTWWSSRSFPTFMILWFQVIPFCHPRAAQAHPACPRQQAGPYFDTRGTADPRPGAPHLEEQMEPSDPAGDGLRQSGLYRVAGPAFKLQHLHGWSPVKRSPGKENGGAFEQRRRKGRLQTKQEGGGV